MSDFLEKLILEAYQKFRPDDRDYLTIFEFKCCSIYIFGYKPSSWQIEKYIGKKTQISFNELKRVINLLSKDHKFTLNQKFELVDRHDLGYIDLDQFLQLFKDVGLCNISSDYIKQIFNALDINNQGRITLEDLEEIFEQNDKKLF